MSWKDEFENNLEKYNIQEDKKSDALAVYYISKYFDINDFNYLWNERKISKGGDGDRKIDALYFNEEDHYIAVAQGYMSKADNNGMAPRNKADELSTALNAIFAVEDSTNEELNFTYKYDSKKIKENINNIDNVYIFYVHNKKESIDIERILKAVKDSATKLIPNKNIICKEVGEKSLENEFNRKNENILIKDKVEFTLQGDNYFELKNNTFKILNTIIKGKELQEICKKYSGDNLDNIFSANLRNYLGSSKAKDKINKSIINTIKTEPNKFYIFNNGITILTNKFNFSEDNKKIILDGFSIINGAQTTGAINSMSEILSDELIIQTRIIEKPTENKDNFLENIILYNNTQNQIESADIRSNDEIQKKLIKSFEENGYGYKYSGGKRGGKKIDITNNDKFISHYKVGQLLWTFHEKEPKEAYNNRKLFFDNDEKYKKLFIKDLSSRHIIFLYIIFSSITVYRNKLNDKKTSSNITTTEEEILNYLNKKGIEYIIMASIPSFLEKIYGQKLSNKFSVEIKKGIDISNCIENINEAIENLIKLIRTKLRTAFTDNNEVINRLGNTENIIETMNEIDDKINIFEKDEIAKFTRIKEFIEI